jgi:NADH:ubiquinone oxidoreductase subunit 3 (subunit A)
MYALPGVLIVAVVFMLVLGQTLKTARQNPVDNLRYE